MPECSLVNKSKMELEDIVSSMMGLPRAAVNDWLASWGLLLLGSEGFWAFLWLCPDQGKITMAICLSSTNST